MPLQPMITGARHMISAGHYLAAEAGHAVLQAGGNVVDAGVAAGIGRNSVESSGVWIREMTFRSASKKKITR